jgi:uncharacterized protein
MRSLTSGAETASHTAADSLRPFVGADAALLTTFRRGGGGVATPVNIVVEDDHAYFRSYDEAGKVKRLRRSSRVHIVPASWRGRPTGAAVSARARRLDGEEADHAARLLAAKHPLLQGRVVPLMHRLRGWKTVHYELRMVDDAEPQPFAAASFERRRRFHMAGPPQGNAT